MPIVSKERRAELAKKKRETEIKKQTLAEKNKNKPKTTEPIILRDESGKPTGVKLPDGREFIGIPRKETLGQVDKYNESMTKAAGYREVGEAKTNVLREEEKNRRIEEATPGVQEILANNEIPEEKQLVQPFRTEEGKQQFGEAFYKEVNERGLFGEYKKNLQQGIKEKIENIEEGGDPATAYQLAMLNVIDGFKSDLLTLASGTALSLRIISAKTIGKAEIAGLDVDKILGSEEQEFKDIKSSLDKRKEIVSTVTGISLDGGAGLTPAEALETLNTYEAKLEEDEAELQQLATVYPNVYELGLQDVQTTILQQRIALYDARNAIANAVLTGDLDPIKVFQAQYKVDELNKNLKGGE